MNLKNKKIQNFFEFRDGFRKAADGRRIILFLDYDGTLAQISDHPGKAVLSSENKSLLEKLSRHPDVYVAIISGRALADVRAMVGVGHIMYVGNHGLEIDGPEISFESLASVPYKKAVEVIKAQLQEKLPAIKGAWLEDKGLTLTVHYRLVAPKDLRRLKKIFDMICFPYRKEKIVKINPGKKVWELKPPISWDKGKAAIWILKKQQSLVGADQVLPVYIGDDVTDEDAFAALGRHAVTIVVGRDRKSRARYSLANPGEVTKFLKEMIEFLRT